MLKLLAITDGAYTWNLMGKRRWNLIGQKKSIDNHNVIYTQYIL